MFERFTERARRVLFFGRYEASQLGSISIETEHLLLGLVREGKGLSGIRQDIERRVVIREKFSTSVEIPFSAETKRVLQFAADESDRLGHNYIGNEHLLLGLLREERSVAAIILTSGGMTLQRLRDEIVRLTDAPPSGDDAIPAQRTGREAFAPGMAYPWPTPHFVPSDVVHISFSRFVRAAGGGEGEESDARSGIVSRPGASGEGSQVWEARAASLSEVVAGLLSVRHDRVRMQPPLSDDQRYDMVLLPAAPRSGDEIAALVQSAIETQLRLTIRRETTAEGDIVVIATHPSVPD